MNFRQFMKRYFSTIKLNDWMYEIGEAMEKHELVYVNSDPGLKTLQIHYNHYFRWRHRLGYDERLRVLEIPFDLPDGWDKHTKIVRVDGKVVIFNKEKHPEELCDKTLVFKQIRCFE